MPDSRRRAGRPARTSREEILAGARRVIDRDGWQKLTLRGLGAELGVGASTIYHHVHDREDLLIQLLNDLATQRLPEELPREPRARIIAGAVAIHGALLASPWAAEVLTADGFLARLGDAARGIVEQILSAAVEAGASPERAAEIFRHLWYYTAGEILVRARSDASEAARTQRAAWFEGLDADRLPVLAQLGPQWPELAARDTYAEGVAALVDGLLRSRG